MYFFKVFRLVTVLWMLMVFTFIQAQEEDQMLQITVNGVEVHYKVFGEGTPLLVLHGFPLDHEVMVHAYEPIFKNRDGYMRIYPDFPGMGFSPVDESVTTADDILRVMIDFMNELAPDQQYVVAGLSYGGYIAQGMVLKNPDPIAGVMLMAPVVSPDDENRELPEPLALVVDPEAVAMVPEGLAPVILSNTVVQTKPVIERILTEFGPGFARINAEFVGQLRQPENYSFSFDVRESDTTYDKPTLILTGRQDSTVGFAEAYGVSNLYTRATYAVLDRAGHGVYMEQDTLFKVLVHEWLDRVEESMST